MSKPLYMQVSDLQNELNRARDRSDYVKEELAAAKAALASLAAELAAAEARILVLEYENELLAARAVLAGEDTT